MATLGGLRNLVKKGTRVFLSHRRRIVLASIGIFLASNSRRIIRLWLWLVSRQKAPNKPQITDVHQTALESQLIRQWNATGAAYPLGAPVPASFELSAMHSPSGIALLFADHAMSYKQLHRCSTDLALALQGRITNNAGVIGLCVEKGPEEVCLLDMCV